MSKEPSSVSTMMARSSPSTHSTRRAQQGRSSANGADKVSIDDSCNSYTTAAATTPSPSLTAAESNPMLVSALGHDTAAPREVTCTSQLNLLTMKRVVDLPLYEVQDVPLTLQQNEWIRTGYRAYYTTSQVLRSMTGWHNETLNVWTHFLGFLLFAALTVGLFTAVLVSPIPAAGLPNARPIYGLFCAGCMLCMLNSSLYHLFIGHVNHTVVCAMSRLDFLGITVLIVVSFLPPLYIMYNCHPILRAFYISFIISLGIAGVVGPWTSVFQRHVGVRTGVYLAMGFSGIIPGAHALFLFPMGELAAWTFGGLSLMAMLYVSGVVIYITRFPECLFPGKFDFFLSSHQLWHFFVLMAAIVHYFNCVGMLQVARLSNGAC